jgi:hypothetical protein
LHQPGIFGTDLGFAVPVPNTTPKTLEVLFGDTWAAPTDACAYPELKRDDLVARIPATPPGWLESSQPTAAGKACGALRFTRDDADDPTSWRRIRLFPDAGARSDDRALDTGMLRTPLTAWSDDTHVFAIFMRGQYARCQTNADCPTAMACTKDPNYRGKRLGGCQPHVTLSNDAAPAFCRDDSDCASPRVCADLNAGLCVATAPFTVQRGGETISPPWYTDDPRHGAASILYVASAFWPDRPEDFATGALFTTNKFTNPTARSVAHFDPKHPENNDYRPGHETLLLWGRPAFVGRDGFQALPFLAYQPMSGLLHDDGTIAWNPMFFAGYDAAGDPSWSDREADAQPIYGVDENLKRHHGKWVWDWQSPEFDYVNQMSTLWAEPLGRWLMLYGGSTPAMIDPSSGARPAPTHAQVVPGAVHLRSALHPFGRAHASSPATDGFGPPRPVLTPTAVANELACDQGVEQSERCTPGLNAKAENLLDAVSSAVTELSPDDLLSASAKCAAGSAALGMQYSVGGDSEGHLYGTAIIGPWTRDASSAFADEPSVELYWNVSTWNPYQVLLVKTVLRASDFAR